MEDFNSPLIDSLESTSIKDSVKSTNDNSFKSVTERDEKQNMIEDNKTFKESCTISKNEVTYHKISDDHENHESSAKNDDVTSSNAEFFGSVCHVETKQNAEDNERTIEQDLHSLQYQKITSEDDEQMSQKLVEKVDGCTGDIGANVEDLKPLLAEQIEEDLTTGSHTENDELELNRNEDKIENDSNVDPAEYQELHGHKFDENFVLRDVHGKQFNFNLYDSRCLNQERYTMIGEAIDEYIYKHLESRCRMIRHYIPFDATTDEPRGFFFASENADKTEDKLLILIHGSGVVRAGQWARRIIINDNLMDGSQIPYIEKAYEEGYEVVILNANQNEIGNEFIKGSHVPEEHALYVWDNFIMKRTKAKRIAIMAHSYGGSVTVFLAEKRKDSFTERVFAVGFSDSVHSFGFADTNYDVVNFLVKNARNWVTSSDKLDTVQRSYSFLKNVPKVSAGHTKHEWTSASCMESVFKFFRSKLEVVERNLRGEIFPGESGIDGKSDDDDDEQECYHNALGKESEVDPINEGRDDDEATKKIQTPAATSSDLNEVSNDNGSTAGKCSKTNDSEEVKNVDKMLVGSNSINEESE